MEFIKIIDLAISFLGVPLFEIPNLQINTNEKIGLVGANGVGKTTLMRTILQLPKEAHGQVIKNCSTIYVPQLLPQTNQSGGQKQKAALSYAFHQLKRQVNGVLLLDEPTSNLDKAGQNWLIARLQALTNPILLISHDRRLLNTITNSTWVLKNRQVIFFNGNFAAYEKEQIALEKHQQTQNHQHKIKCKELQKEYTHKQSQGHTVRNRKASISVADWKSHGDATGKQRKLLRQSRILAKKIAIETAAIKPSHKQQPITLKNITADLTKLNISTRTNLLSIKPQIVNWQAKKLFKVTHELRLQANSKIALMGPNGSGKSIFLKLMANHELAGLYNPKLSSGFFIQDLTRLLTNKTVLNKILQESIFTRSTTMQLLGDLHLQSSFNKPIMQLSGGQLVCFNLARVLLGRHNLLLLDEPTNFLDIDSTMALTDFIKNYPFALIIVSHDQLFIDDLNLPEWQIKDGKLLDGAYLQTNTSSRQEKITLLKFKRDQLIANPMATFDQIQAITRQLQQLTK